MKMTNEEFKEFVLTKTKFKDDVDYFNKIHLSFEDTYIYNNHPHYGYRTSKSIFGINSEEELIDFVNKIYIDHKVDSLDLNYIKKHLPKELEDLYDHIYDYKIKLNSKRDHEYEIRAANLKKEDAIKCLEETIKNIKNGDARYVNVCKKIDNGFHIGCEVLVHGVAGG